MSDMEDLISKKKLTLLMSGVFLISSSLLAFEIAFARLMSVMLSYHYVFAIVSLSLFGLGIGGIVVQFSRPKASDDPSPFDSFSWLSGLCSLAMAVSVIIAIRVGHMNRLGTNLFLYGGIFFVPFFLGGMFLAKVFSRFPSLSSKVYGSDLVGAAAGCIGVVLALNAFGAVCAIFLFATLTSLSSILFSMASEST